jgi:hypothetical protein
MILVWEGPYVRIYVDDNNEWWAMTTIREELEKIQNIHNFIRWYFLDETYRVTVDYG